MFACHSRQQQALNTLSSIANQTANLPLAMRFFRTFARLSPRLALRVNNLESVWEELVDGVFYTEIWSANGIVMLYLSNGSRDQKQAKVLLLPKSLSKMVWWTRDHVKSVSCHGDVRVWDTESPTIRSSCCFRWSDDNQVTFPLIRFLVCYK